MQSAYHSPGKRLQQHEVLMLDTQINLRPALTALLSSSWTHLVALKHGHLDSEDCLLFSRMVVAYLLGRQDQFSQQMIFSLIRH